MARINKAAITKMEIVQEATKQFLEKGFTATTVSAMDSNRSSFCARFFLIY